MNTTDYKAVKNRLMQRYDAIQAKRPHQKLVVRSCNNGQIINLFGNIDAPDVVVGQLVIAEYQGKTFVSEIVEVHHKTSPEYLNIHPVNKIIGVVFVEAYEFETNRRRALEQKLEDQIAKVELNELAQQAKEVLQLSSSDLSEFDLKV